MKYIILPVDKNTPDCARKSIDGTKWICHNELLPTGVKPLEFINEEAAKVIGGKVQVTISNVNGIDIQKNVLSVKDLMATKEWTTAENNEVK